MKRIISTITTIATISWSIGLGTLVPFIAVRADALAYATAPAKVVSGNASIKASSADTAILAFRTPAHADSSLANVQITIASTGNPALQASNIANVKLVLDTDDNGTFNAATDTVRATNASITVGGAFNIAATPVNEDLVTAAKRFFVTIATSATAPNGAAFTVTFSAVDIGDHTPNPQATATTDTFTIDTVAPTVAGGLPSGQTNVPTDVLIDLSFSENVLASSATTTTFTLKTNVPNTQAGVPTGATLCTSVTVTNAQVKCEGATLTPSTSYTITATTGITDAAGNALAANHTRTFTTGSIQAGGGSNNTTPPRVLSTFPNAGAQNVPTNAKLGAEFPQGPEGNMKSDGGANAINNVANVSIKQVVNFAPGSELCNVSSCTLAWDATARRLNITQTVLTVGAEFDFCVRSAAQNQANQGLPVDFCVRFKTGSGADTTAPTLRTTGATFPGNGDNAVSIFIPDLRVAFSKEMDTATFPATLTTVSLFIDTNANSAREGGETRLGSTDLSIRYDGFEKATHLNPKAPLTANTRYCFEVVGGASDPRVKDVNGTALAATSTSNCFTTLAAETADTAGPKILFADADNFKLVAHFNEPLAPTSAVTLTNYTLECPTGLTVNLATKPITYKADAKEVEIQNMGLTPGTSCKLTVGTGVTDIAGNAMDTSGTPANNITEFKVQDSATTGGSLGAAPQQDFHSGTNFATFWERPQRCQPRATATNKATSLECEFPAPEALVTGAKFILTFPSGFTLTNAAAVAASASHKNKDLNGPGPGITTISALAADNASGNVTVTITHTGDAMNANDMLKFELSGITTPTTAVTDARISIVIKNSSGVKIGQTVQASPFTIGSAGELSITGKVCKGSSSGGSCAGGDTGIANVKVVCKQEGSFQVGAGGAAAFVGHQDTTTGGDGSFSFTGLTTGEFGCTVPPDPTNLADTGGNPPFQKVLLTTVNKTALDFKFKDFSAAGGATDVTVITFNITGGPATTDLDIVCNAGKLDVQLSKPSIKKVTTDGTGAATTTHRLQQGKTYECSVGPHIPFEQFATGGPPPIPDFNFMPPKPQQISVTATPQTIAFALLIPTAGVSITGFVRDGSNNGIGSAFVHAFPLGCFDDDGSVKQCNGAFAQSKSDGSFTLNVANGTYEVSAEGPGLPNSTKEIVNVKGVSPSAITLKMAKSSITISGEILDESGNGIKFAHVNAEKITAGGTCSSFTPAGGFADSPTDSTGNYTLYVSNGTWCVRAFSPAYGEINNKTIVIASDTSASGQNIQATTSDYGTITGTVTKGGTNTSGGFVNCFGSAGGNHAQTGSDGSFSMKVKTGTYTCDGFIPGVGPLPRQESVAVTSGGTTTLATDNLAVGNPATINVTITGITDAFCDARDTNGRGSSTGQNNNGVYSIFVPAGTYTVRCGGPKYGPLVTQTGLTVTAGGTTTVTGTAPTTRTVAGRLTDGTNNLEGASLNFTEKSSGKSFLVKSGSQAGSNNNLSGTGIPEGTYNLTATKKGYEPATTTVTVSGGNATLSAPIALTPASGANGASATVTVQSSSVNYAGDATVLATKDGKTVAIETDATTGTAAVPLTNGTWTVKAIGDNGKESATTTVTVTGGVVQGTAPTLSLANTITGFTAASTSETVALSTGGLLKFNDLAVAGKVPEVNIPSSTLSTSDTSTGKVEMKSDPTIVIDPGADQNFVGSSGYDISPKDANGNAIKDISGSVTITIPYTDADVSTAGVDESKLTISSYNTASQTWESFPTTVDTTNNLLVAQVTHFSSFGILGSVRTASSGDITPPKAPTNLKTKSDGKTITLTWTDPADSDLSRILILRNNGGTTPISGDAYTTLDQGKQTFVDTNVTSGTTYKYIVRAQDSFGNTELNLTEVAQKVEGAVTAPPVTTPSTTPTAPAVTVTPTVTPAKPATPVTPTTPKAPLVTEEKTVPKTAVDVAKTKSTTAKSAVNEAKTALADAKAAVKEAKLALKDTQKALKTATKSKDKQAIADAKAAVKEAKQVLKTVQRASVNAQKAVTKAQVAYNKANAALKKSEAAMKKATAKTKKAAAKTKMKKKAATKK